MAALTSAALVVKAKSSRATRQSRIAPVCSLQRVGAAVAAKAESAAKMAAALAASALIASSAGAFSYDELQGKTYLQVKGSGEANSCSVLSGGSATISVPAGQYKVQEMCLEPTSFTVKEDSQFKDGKSEFVPTKLMTRLTYTLDDISGDLSVGGGGSVDFKEKDGIDFAATTVQLPGGERVPFLFTIRDLAAKGNWSSFGGDFAVPSYRGSSFLDPKGRAGSIGYDNAVALPAAGAQDFLEKENVKSTVALKGTIVFTTAKYNPATNEVAGVFESVQPSDTDLGSKAPKDIKIQGLWYAQLAKA